ncbi:MAG: hypothetical protein IJE10_09225 [Clostridia bacterium]|nr:hypothetical protein [Clostridia bacterium]
MMYNLERKADFSEKFWLFSNYFFAMVSIFLMIVPIVQAPLLGGLYTLIMATVMGGWFCTSYFLRPNWFFNGTICGVLAFLFIGIYVYFALLGIGNAAEMFIMIAGPWYVFLVYYYYYYTDKKQALGSLGCVVFLAFAFTLFTTLLGLIENPASYREFSSQTDMIAENYFKNIGNVHHIYCSILIGTMLLCMLQGKCLKKCWVRVAAWIIVIICFCLALICSTGTVFVCAFLAPVLVILQNRTPATKFVVTIFSLAFLLFFKSVVGAWLQEAATHIENHYISWKVYDMGSSLIGGEATGDMAARSDRWLWDLETFFNTYGLGVGSYYQGAGNGTYVVHEHSQLFSDMARYGFWFTAAMGVFYYKMAETIKKGFEKLNLNCKYTALYIIFFIMYVAQPVMLNFIIPTCILFMVPASPYIIDYVNQKTTRKLKRR